jgi:hypothetical protein
MMAIEGAPLGLSPMIPVTGGAGRGVFFWLYPESDPLQMAAGAFKRVRVLFR